MKDKQDNLQYKALSDKGMERVENQDCQDVVKLDWGTVLIVADGMGGHKGGREASRTAVEAIGNFLRGASLPESVPEACQKLLWDSIVLANEAVHARSGDDPSFQGMGTTVVIAVVSGNSAYIAHVGDSRLYHVRGGLPAQVTTDHTTVEEMIRREIISREQAKDHPEAHKLSRALGVKPDVEPEVRQEPITLEPGDSLVLCSDGLTDVVEDDEIARVVSTENPEKACPQLVKMANDRGGPDNITVIVARMPGVPLAPPRGQTEQDIPLMEPATVTHEPPQDSDVGADFGLEDPIPYWRRRGGFLLLAAAILLATNVATFFISRSLAPPPPAAEAAVAVDGDLSKHKGKNRSQTKEIKELKKENAKLKNAVKEKDKQLKQLQSQKPDPATRVEPVKTPSQPSARVSNAHAALNTGHLPAGSRSHGADTVDMQILEQPKLPKGAAKDERPSRPRTAKASAGVAATKKAESELKCIPDDFPAHAGDIIAIRRHLTEAQALVSDRVKSSTHLSGPQRHLSDALSQIDSQLRGVPSSLCMKEYRKTKDELARYCTMMAMKYAKKKTPEDCKEAGKWADSAELFKASTRAVSVALAPCKKEKPQADPAADSVEADGTDSGGGGTNVQPAQADVREGEGPAAESDVTDEPPVTTVGEDVKNLTEL